MKRTNYHHLPTGTRQFIITNVKWSDLPDNTLARQRRKPRPLMESNQLYHKLDLTSVRCNAEPLIIEAVLYEPRTIVLEGLEELAGASDLTLTFTVLTEDPGPELIASPEVDDILEALFTPTARDTAPAASRT